MRRRLVDRVPSAFACALLVAGCVSIEPPADEVPPLDCPTGFHDDPAGSHLCLEDDPPPLRPVEGDFVIASVADAADLCAAGDAVVGNVTVRGEIEHLDELSCLRQVAGTLRIDAIDLLRSVVLPDLTWVGGDLSIQLDTNLQQINLPLLEEVGGGLAVQFNPLLAAVALPRLAFAGGFVSFYDNFRLNEVDLPELTEVGVEAAPNRILYVRLNERLDRISLPKLTWVAGVLKVSSNRGLTSLEVPALEATGRGVYVSYNEDLEAITLPIRSVGGFLYFDHTRATSIHLPNLEAVADNFEVLSNPELTDLQAPLLSSVGAGLVITDNPQLPQSAVDAFIDAIGEENIGGPIRTENNGPD